MNLENGTKRGEIKLKTDYDAKNVKVISRMDIFLFCLIF